MAVFHFDYLLSIVDLSVSNDSFLSNVDLSLTKRIYFSLTRFMNHPFGGGDLKKKMYYYIIRNKTKNVQNT